MSGTLHIGLLGDFNLSRDGELVTSIDTPRLQALLAYLVLHAGVPQSRQHLAFLFWPDSAESQARTNLRQVLHHLRHALPDADSFIEADTKTVRWRQDALFALDVNDFTEAASRAERSTAPETARAALEEAVHLYRGELLPSCYDEWIEPEREHLRQQYIAALEALVQQLEALRAYAEAIRYAQLLLENDPIRETTYRSLMRLHALRRDRASALRVYHDCATVLQRELSIQPAPITQDFHERLLSARHPPAPVRTPTLAAEVPLIGRQAEWKQLHTAWQAARQGQAHFVSIAGEAGIGKTRLAEEFITWTHRQGLTTSRARCYAAEGRLAFGPLIEWLRTPAFKDPLSRLDTVWRDEVARLLPELTAEDPDASPPEPVVEHWQRRRLFEALARAVLEARQPLTLLIDDLQWSDQDTLEWLHYLLRFDAHAQLLIMSTTRTDELAPMHPVERLLMDLRRTDQLTEIVLRPLSAAETRSLAEHVSDVSLDGDQASIVYRETEGNPLFVVEGMRANALITPEHVPSQSKTSARSQLPSKVRAILTMRLAQLSPSAHALVHLAATFGRSFTFEMLAATHQHDEDALVRALDELWQRRIIREQGTNEYDFSHDKLREVAYAEISPARRRHLHRSAAEALTAVHANDLVAVSGALAGHYERAGLLEQATVCYQQAAERAQRVHANAEAIDFLRRALAVLKTLPSTHERDARELALCMLLGPSLVATQGWASTEASRVYERALALSHEGSDPAERIPILWGLRTFYIVRAEFEPARQRGEELLNLAQQEQDETLRTAAYLTLAITQFHPASSHLPANGWRRRSVFI